MPVSPSSYIYAQFEHVNGVRAPEGGQGVSINRLKIIDTLIGQISQTNKKPEVFQNMEGMDNDRINYVIEQYQQQVRKIQETQANSPYMTAMSSPPRTGMLFNIFA